MLINKFTKKYALFLLMFLALIFFTINLKGSLGFFDDTARDTIKALEIIQNRTLTLIGPPLSLGLFSIREIYFGSLSLYIAAIGLLLARLDVIGAIYPNIFFFTVSIYFFYQLIKDLTSDKKTQIISTIIYALSPSTITFARFFWNPNLIIPFSVFFWLLILKKYSSKKQKVVGFLLAGVIAGMMVNLHYASLGIIILSFIFFFLKRQFLNLFSLFTGFFIGSLPLILFELKHQFYLSQAFIYNLSHRSAVQEIGNKILHFFSGILVILGFMPSEISHPTVNFNQSIIYLIIFVIGYLIFKSFKLIKRDRVILLIPIFFMNVVAVVMSNQIYNIHYIFPVYPLLIWYVGHLLSLIKNRLILVAVFLIMFYASIAIPYDQHNIKKDYLSITEIETIANYIVNDRPISPYNITENITGGAQAIPFRYILLRDAKIKPNDKLSYTNLKTLYVVTSDINKSYKENRWEFSATPNKKLVKTVDFSEVKLYKFETNQ